MVKSLVELCTAVCLRNIKGIYPSPIVLTCRPLRCQSYHLSMRTLSHQTVLDCPYIHTYIIHTIHTYLPTYIHLFLHPPTTSLFISTFDTHRILFFLDLPSYLGIKAFAFILKHTIIKHTASAYLFYFSFGFYYFSIHFLPLFPRSPRNHTKQKKNQNFTQKNQF